MHPLLILEEREREPILNFAGRNDDTCDLKIFQDINTKKLKSESSRKKKTRAKPNAKQREQLSIPFTVQEQKNHQDT